MSYTNDPIYYEMEIEIYENLQIYYNDNWEDYDGEWDDFKDEALQELYNSGNQIVEQNFNKLLFCLRVIKEEYEEYGTFNDWDNPQKIFNLAYYFVAQTYFGKLDKIPPCLNYSNGNEEDEEEEEEDEPIEDEPLEEDTIELPQ